ncbi:MAG: YdiU family protein, partial [Lentisphaeria bacterium]|nr:protein adenylyltransferase SelO family protein [Lentisphaeria bacterium]NQZ68005.1 YdiU family protein [Lentisphaeria bacterium]
AMTSLGVPATRALAAVATGDDVQRETVMPGGVFTRVADSHIRIGTFQYFASRVDIDALKTLLDYTIKRHYPEIEDGSAILFFRAFIKRQISLVTQWMSIGFIHGVMNTDNMAISGETIDFGPCAFMDKFHNLKVFSSIDRNGRYAYSNQGPVLAWNMARLADCLIPLVDDDEDKAIEMLTEELAPISDQFTEKLNERMTAKLGLTSDDADLVDTFLSHLEKEELDFTLSFRALGDGSTFPEFEKEWKARLNERELDFDETVESIKKINPLYIPRNHQVERAIQGALVGDLTVFHEMNRVLKNPFEFQEDLESYSLEPKPEEVVCATFCGT